MKPLLWMDGRVVDRAEFVIDPADGGLLYGLGLFETTRTFGGLPWLWDRHLRRLRRSAAALELSLIGAAIPSSEDVADFVGRLDAGDVVVRLNATAGPAGGRPKVWMTARPLPEPIEALRLTCSPCQISRTDPLAAHKSLNYGTRRLAHQDAAAKGFDDALLLDPCDQVLEACYGNLFFRLESGWVTPALQGGVLAGTVRELLLERSAAPVVRATAFAYESLRQAREAFFTNSVRGGVPIRSVDSWTFKSGVETELFQRLTVAAQPSL